ncbi:hypothetical protein [Rufibacter ruber]|uniref:hypothetical protein n=1 Tax=Rufibacter ruber TaxID=1783499 RepID=UPI00082DAFDC|nr:hypothetical protein [Rufibacter ruber]
MRKYTFLSFILTLFLASCGGGFSNQDKARNLVQEWNARNLDEAGYASISFDGLTRTQYKKTPAYRITHKFNYGNRGREREYYYFLDTTFTQVLGRKRTDWDKENQIEFEQEGRNKTQ